MAVVLQVSSPWYREHNATNIEKPEIVGFFSLNTHREYVPDMSQLKYVKKIIKEKVVSFNLNLKMNEGRHKPYHMDEKIKHLLTFLLHNEKRLQLRTHQHLDLCRFYCNRGVLAAISCTPYDRFDGWRVVATLFKGNIYLCMRDIEKRQMKPTNEQIKYTAWGYKFEHFLGSDSTNSEPQPNEPIDEREQFSVILKTKINNHYIMYGAETDGILFDDDTKDAPGVDATIEETLQYLRMREFVELKTSRLLELSWHRIVFMKKVMKWWIQCHLGGIDTLICGYRTDDGVVKTLKPHKIQDFTYMAKHGKWSPQECMNFLNRFLSCIKHCFESKIIMKHGKHHLQNIDKLPLMWLHFEYNPAEPVVRLTNNYVYEVDPILPQWFVRNFQKNQ